MEYTKMHGAGNDFIIINNIIEKIPRESFSIIASTLCSRRLSIGADGLMFLEEADALGDFKMSFYNSDGSQGEMCGNGARCICRYGYEKGLAGQVQSVETISGLVKGWRIDKRNYKVKLNRPSVINLDYALEVDGITYDCSYIELGDPGLPHLVLNLSNYYSLPEDQLYKIGKGLRNHDFLHKGANVNFYSLDSQGTIYGKTFERGVEDFTLSCGTGAGSIGLVLIKKEIIQGGEAKINMPGGIIRVLLEKVDNTYEELIIIGPTNIVSQGRVLDEDFVY